MKKRLLALLKAKEEQRATLNKSIIESENKEERAAIGATLEALEKEIADVRAMLDEIDEPAGEGEGEPAAAGANVNGEGRNAFNPLATMAMRNGTPAKKEDVDKYDTPEYRTAFMKFCTRGEAIPAEYRDTTTTTESAAVIPTTILKEIIKELKVYGNVYEKVRKLNVQGGVQIPILSLKPTATWITADTGTSESTTQKIQANTSISFNYYGLECKVSQTLLSNITALDVFNEQFSTLSVEAIAQALDIAIFNGSGSGEPLGVLNDTNIPAANKVTMSPTDFVSWGAWKKKVFGAMKKAYRNGTFFMAQSTFDGYIDGMTDDNGQPIGRVNYGIDGGENYRFGGKEVETVETDVIKDYDTASTGDVVAVFFKPTDYAINTNMEMRVVKWVDNDTNEIKNKVILIADGKLVDAHGVILIKKGAAAG